LDWVLNEKGYAILDRWITGEKESPFELQKPVHFHLNADHLSYALKDKDLCVCGNFFTDHCNFIEKKSGHAVFLEHFKFAANRTSQKGPVQVELQASMNKQGKVLLKGELKDPFTGKIAGQIEKLPTILLDVGARFFKRVDFPFSTFFGETLNAQISTDLKNFTGPIFLNVHSPNVRTSLTGNFDNRVLSLKEPLHAQMLMTHKISSLFLKEVNPLSITSIESIHPVTLQIDHVGFSLPFSADWSKLQVPSAHIELGEIFCKNEGNIHLALSLLKQNQDPMPDLKLWFTPIDLHIENQVCKVERTEILINNSLEICTFGEINLGKEDVNMILGLPCQCLHKAFGIENLPPDYVLHIPLKGTLDNVKLDSKKATAKLTTLLLWQKSSNKLGEIGAFIGEIIGKLATLPDRDTESPPAKVPYPWDKNKVAKVKQPKTKKKSKIKKDEKPLKALLKILT
jgi:hypothetical protein